MSLSNFHRIGIIGKNKLWSTGDEIEVTEAFVSNNKNNKAMLKEGFRGIVVKVDES